MLSCLLNSFGRIFIKLTEKQESNTFMDEFDFVPILIRLFTSELRSLDGEEARMFPGFDFNHKSSLINSIIVYIYQLSSHRIQ